MIHQSQELEWDRNYSPVKVENQLCAVKEFEVKKRNEEWLALAIPD